MARSIAAARKASGLLRCRSGSSYGYSGKPIGLVGASGTPGDATWRQQAVGLRNALAWLKGRVPFVMGSTSLWAPTAADAADYARYLDGMFQIVEQAQGRWVYWQCSEWNQGGFSEAPYYEPTYAGTFTSRREPVASLLERHLTNDAQRPCGLHWIGGDNGVGGAQGAGAATSTGFCNANPGTLDSTYHYNSLASARYVAIQNPNYLLSISYRWERLQQSFGAALDATKLAELQTAVNNVTGAGLRASLMLFNYGCYWQDDGGGVNGVRRFIGDTNLPILRFQDFYYRMAQAFPYSSYPGLFGWTIMDEPGHGSAPTAGCSRTTLVSNFEAAGLDSWVFEGGGTSGLARDTGLFRAGVASLGVTATWGAFGVQRLERPISPGGTTLNARIWVYLPAGAPGARDDWQGYLYAKDGGGSHFTDTSTGMRVFTLQKGQWNLISGNWSGLSGITTLGIEIYYNGGSSSGSVQVNFDEVYLGAASRGTYWEQVTQCAVTAIRAGGDLQRRIAVQWWGEFQSGDRNTFWHPDGDFVYDPANNYEYESHHFPDYNNAGGSMDYDSQVAAAQVDGW